jgi:hypothetical protein
MRLRPCALLALLAAVLVFAFAPGRALAQDDGTSVSGSIADNTPTSGLTTDFDPDGGFTQGDLHTDVSDPTHAQLLGSALSPTDFSYTAADVSANVNSSTLTDAQSAVGASDLPGFGGARNQSFAAGSSSTTAVSSERQDSRQAFASGSLTAAFSGGISKSAFSGRSTQLTHAGGQSFSGQGVSLPPLTVGVGPTQTLVQTSGAEEGQQAGGAGQALATQDSDSQGSYYATDPALTGQAETSIPSLQLGPQIPSPKMDASGFFLEPSFGNVRQYEYDDGQTPPTAASRALIPGAVLSEPPDYIAAASGFPDSTMGTAALPTEASNFVSSIVPLKDPDAPPFPAVSDGNVFGVKVGLHPSLHKLGQTPLHGSFRDYERKVQEERLLHGMSITQAQQFYQADLRSFQKAGNGERKSTIQPFGSNQDQNQTPIMQTTYKGVIR